MKNLPMAIPAGFEPATHGVEIRKAVLLMQSFLHFCRNSVADHR